MRIPAEGRTYAVTVSRDHHERLRAVGCQAGLSIKDVTRQAIEAYLVEVERADTSSSPEVSP